ncbi:hypothetical protein BDP81DRAFT_152751 [Colletotrichum phormii]|uniref:Uncharacterized protein n=1 Tax=Colletotrichum phormii TaxID=359342 RepID=A0AAI9ZD79_9PEZI|nr:uncharacterized protein BDP81DRAFT_152751 [Colletotrichum phormii]KAK1622384.1 hypothetical protein BDP81DRAFT_152751 [Colletotrichum phormii]
MRGTRLGLLSATQKLGIWDKSHAMEPGNSLSEIIFSPALETLGVFRFDSIQQKNPGLAHKNPTHRKRNKRKEKSHYEGKRAGRAAGSPIESYSHTCTHAHVRGSCISFSSFPPQPGPRVRVQRDTEGNRGASQAWPCPASHHADEPLIDRVAGRTLALMAPLHSPSPWAGLGENPSHCGQPRRRRPQFEMALVVM